MKVIYTGKSDFQEFDANDFKKAGIDGQKKVKFAQGEPTEVSDEAGQALVGAEGIFGPYSFKAHEENESTSEKNSDDGEENPSALEQTELADEGLEATNEGSAPAVKSTGRGSSTRGKA